MSQNKLKLFKENGGQFFCSDDELIAKAKKIKAFVFDWDGVFTDGSKDAEMQSSFSEVDSMGINLLRFSYYLKNEELPITAIISGENNKTSFTLSKREGFEANFFKIKNKIIAADFICEQHNIKKDEIFYVFDDVLDVSLAKECGLRCYIPRTSNPAFNNYITENNLADYCTINRGGKGAVREVCEMFISVSDSYNDVVNHRVSYSKEYATYIEKRNETKTSFFTLKGNIINKAEI